MNFHIVNKNECFLDQKNGVFRKIQKKKIQFCQKIEVFINYFFWANLARKDRFLIFWIKKNAV